MAEEALLYELTAPEDCDGFGNAVATLGDLDGDGADDFAVGAPLHNLGVPPFESVGRVYLYSGKTGADLGAIDPEPGASEFGWALAAIPDVDGDGTLDLLVGAPGIGDPFLSTGHAYLYSVAARALLRAWTAEETNDRLGYSVAALSDVNGDGVADLAVGAPYRGPYRRGRVYLYSGADGTSIREHQGEEESDNLGFSLAALPDVNGDGVADLAVGAPHVWDDFVPAGFGRAYLYSGKDGARLQRFVGRAKGNLFGWSVADAGDADGDGASDVAASIPYPFFEEGEFQSRHLAVFSSGSGEVVSETFLNPLWYGGRYVGAIGDLDGDGRGDLWLSESGQVLTFVSGSAGSVVNHHRLEGAVAAAPIGDLDGDGRTDLVVGATGPAQYDCIGPVRTDVSAYSGAWMSAEGLLRLVVGGESPYGLPQVMRALQRQRVLF